MNSSPAAAFAAALLTLCSLAACGDDDDVFRGIVYDAPEFAEGVVFTPATGTPTEQINRFVDLNDLDTTMTASGLVYSVVDVGDTARLGLDTVEAFYKGYLVNGGVFDQQGARPACFLRNRVIDGWKEGLNFIGPGGRLLLLVRPSLGYDSSPPDPQPGRAVITPSTVLVFEIVQYDPLDPATPTSETCRP